MHVHFTAPNASPAKALVLVRGRRVVALSLTLRMKKAAMVFHDGL